MYYDSTMAMAQADECRLVFGDSLAHRRVSALTVAASCGNVCAPLREGDIINGPSTDMPPRDGVALQHPTSIFRFPCK